MALLYREGHSVPFSVYILHGYCPWFVTYTTFIYVVYVTNHGYR